MPTGAFVAVRDGVAFPTGNSGFPKAKRIEASGADGFRYGLQSLKPALEPICLAQKPLEGTGTANWLAHGVGGLNIDGCRIGSDDSVPVFHQSGGRKFEQAQTQPNRKTTQIGTHTLGRWPANLCHDGSPEVLAAFPETTTGSIKAGSPYNHSGCNTMGAASGVKGEFAGDTGSAARFFYQAKADADDRAGSDHPTVKPLALMRWLCRLACPPGGTVLDPFMGTGSTLEAACLEGFHSIGIEREEGYFSDAVRRLGRASGADTPLFTQSPPRGTPA